jgi:3-deoxy-7-phosphoheptulonate synthase
MGLDESNGLVNVNISGGEIRPLPAPAIIIRSMPLPDASRLFVKESRETIKAILRGEEPRRMLIAGPCSIHDIDEALQYARVLKEVQSEIRDTHFLVMRAYLEKPRTDYGWAGFVNDPDINETYDVERGRHESRRFLLELAAMGLPVITEVLDKGHIQNYDDLVSIAAIGARTVEYMELRKMASGFSMPVGMKNGTGGSIKHSIDAMVTAYRPTKFVGIMKETGGEGVHPTKGNPYGFMVLRGGAHPNYDAKSVEKALAAIDKKNTGRQEGMKLVDRIVIDCSHDNVLRDGNRDYHLQEEVAMDVGQQMTANPRIAGLALESYILPGSFPLPKDDLAIFDRRVLKNRPGESITDPCIDQQTLYRIATELDRMLRPVVSRVM